LFVGLLLKFLANLPTCEIYGNTEFKPVPIPGTRELSAGAAYPATVLVKSESMKSPILPSTGRTLSLTVSATFGKNLLNLLYQPTIAMVFMYGPLLN
jgi:hypothetical protein